MRISPEKLLPPLQKIDLITCDIDGTLLSNKGLADENLDILADFIRRHNIPFTIASGRSLEGLTKVAHRLQLADYPLIGDNGAVVYSNVTDAEILYEELLFVPQTGAAVAQLTAAYGPHLEKLILPHTFSSNMNTQIGEAALAPQKYNVDLLKAIYIYKVLRFAAANNIASSYASSHRERAFAPHALWEVEYLTDDLATTYVPLDFAAFSRLPVYKIFLLTDEKHSEQKEVFDQISAWLAPLAQELNIIRYGSYMLDIMLKNVDKSKGVIFLQKHSPYRHIAAIGDALNDLGMLKAADISGCVANAQAELFAWTDFHASGSYNAGVLEFLEFLLRENYL